jgi:hydroxyacylglutathione hydrolase
VPGVGPGGNADTIPTLDDAVHAGEGWRRFLDERGDVVIGAAPGAGCFGAAYEYLFNVSYQRWIGRSNHESPARRLPRVDGEVAVSWEAALDALRGAPLVASTYPPGYSDQHPDIRIEGDQVKFEQYYLECLSQASYLVGDESTGVAAVVDPRRDVAEYVADAEAAGLQIAYVIETHFHADFLSGHLELAAATGAEIIFGAAVEPDFPARLVRDGERISLGEVVLEFRATPGHTPESISIVVYEHAGDREPWGVLTGDTLFIGDVGRPDLLASLGATADELGGMLYDSLHQQLLTLPDGTRVWPAHGAGSACGKNLSTATMSTIGEQRATNYALQPMSRERFVELVTEGQPAAPDYFVHDAILNRRQRGLLDESAPRPLTVDEVLVARGRGAVLLDVRDVTAFTAGHLAGSVNVDLTGRFAEYAGEVIDADDEIVVLADPGTAVEAKIRLGRIGFDNVVGALESVETALVEKPDEACQASRLTASELAARIEDTAGLQVVDVRNQGEVAAGTIPGAVNLPLAALRRRVGELDLDRPIVVHCAGGYRSAIAASWLRSVGATDVSDLLGGYTAWSERHAPANS